MDDLYAIIPVSKFKNAKTRLSPFLSEEEREKLLKVMLQDVTDTLKSMWIKSSLSAEMKMC